MDKAQPTGRSAEILLDLNANCFITKPVVLDNFIRVVKSIESFWLTVVTLPPSESP